MIRRKVTPFGVWLNQQRERMGINSDYDLAQAMGISHVSISKWKSGQQGPSPRHIAVLARVLHVQPIEVYRGLNRLPDDTEWPDDVKQAASDLMTMTPEVRRKVLTVIRSFQELVTGELSLRQANVLTAVETEERER